MNNVLEQSAQAIFDSLAEGCFDGLQGRANLRKPDWQIQPESVKRVFRERARPLESGYFNAIHHTGGQVSWIVRGDGSVHCYRPMTQGHTLKARPQRRKD